MSIENELMQKGEKRLGIKSDKKRSGSPIRRQSNGQTHIHRRMNIKRDWDDKTYKGGLKYKTERDKTDIIGRQYNGQKGKTDPAILDRAISKE